MRTAASTENESTRIFNGYINADASINRGTNFVVLKVGTGAYSVKFTTKCKYVKSITANASGGGVASITTYVVDDHSFQINCYTLAGASVDASFSFLAVVAQ